MVSPKKELEIMYNILREVYRQSIPSADFNLLVEQAPTNEGGQKVIDFMSYEIKEETFMAIIEEEFKKHKRLNTMQKQRIRNSVLLGPSPKFIRNEKRT